MGILAAEVKALVLNELGNGFEDSLEACVSEVQRWAGALQSLKQGCEAVSSLLDHVKRDAKEEVCTLEQAKYAQRYVQRAAGVLDNLRTQAEDMSLKAQGKVDGFRMVVDMTKKMHDKASLRLGELRSFEADPANGGPVNGRHVGTHPGPSIRTKRDEAANGNGTKKKARKKRAKKAKKKAKKH